MPEDVGYPPSQKDSDPFHQFLANMLGVPSTPGLQDQDAGAIVHGQGNTAYPQGGPPVIGAQPKPQSNTPIFPPGLDEGGEDFAEDSPFNIGLAGPSPDEEIDPNAGGAGIPLELQPNELNQIVPGQPQTAVMKAQGELAGQGVGPAVPIGEMAGKTGERRTDPGAYKSAALAGGGMLSPLLMAIWPQIMAMLGRQTAAPVSRQITSRFPTIPTRNALVPYTGGVKPGLTAAGTLGAAAGANPLLDAITGREGDALNTQVGGG